MAKEYFNTPKPQEIFVAGKPFWIQRLTGWDETVAYPTDEGQTGNYIFTVRSNRYTIAIQEVIKRINGAQLPEDFEAHNLLPRVMDLGRSCFTGIIDVSDISKDNNRGLMAFAELTKSPGRLSRDFGYQAFGDVSEYEPDNERAHVSLANFVLKSLLDPKM